MARTSKNAKPRIQKISPKVIKTLEQAGIDGQRLMALYRTNNLNLLRDILCYPAINGVRAKLQEKHPEAERKAWVYRLALDAYLEQYDLGVLMYSTSTEKCLLDSIINEIPETTIGRMNDILCEVCTEEERDIITKRLCQNMTYGRISKLYSRSQGWAREVYQTAVEKFRDDQYHWDEEMINLVFRRTA